MDELFKALADPTRRKILVILKKKDMTVGEIGNNFRMTGATLSHHLDVLKRANLVIAQRKGQFIEYSLNTSVFEETVKMVMEVFGGKKGKK